MNQQSISTDGYPLPSHGPLWPEQLSPERPPLLIQQKLTPANPSKCPIHPDIEREQCYTQGACTRIGINFFF